MLESAKKCQKVLESAKKCQKVPKSAKKCQKVSESARKCRKVPESAEKCQKVLEGLRNNLVIKYYWLVRFCKFLINTSFETSVLRSKLLITSFNK